MSRGVLFTYRMIVLYVKEFGERHSFEAYHHMALLAFYLSIWERAGERQSGSMCVVRFIARNNDFQRWWIDRSNRLLVVWYVRMY